MTYWDPAGCFYEVNYRSRAWRAWGSVNLQSTSQLVNPARTDLTRGNSMTIRTRRGGWVQIRDTQTRRVVFSKAVDERSVRAFMESIARDLEQLMVWQFRQKWGIEA